MTTTQAPIPSGFTAANTAEDVISGIDLTGKTAIVTGGYSGIGLETTKALHNAGAHVVIPARDTTRASQSLQHLANITIEPMDLIDPISINDFATKFLNQQRPLHILINNAGIMANPLTYDARGYESQFATNHLGHFQLATQLWSALKKANGARIVSVSSWGHRYSNVDFGDINFKHREYDRWKAYGQSKTANILFAIAADQRGKQENIRAYALHPGTIVDTDLKRHIDIDFLRQAGVLDEHDNPIYDPSRQMKNVSQGAATNVWCATSPMLDGIGGVYCENSDISPIIPEGASQAQNTEAKGVFPYAIDPVAAERLWILSEQLIGAFRKNNLLV